jgi:hypothetical protein
VESSRCRCCYAGALSPGRRGLEKRLDWILNLCGVQDMRGTRGPLAFCLDFSCYTASCFIIGAQSHFPPSDFFSVARISVLSQPFVTVSASFLWAVRG